MPTDTHANTQHAAGHGNNNDGLDNVRYFAAYMSFGAMLLVVGVCFVTIGMCFQPDEISHCFGISAGKVNLLRFALGPIAVIIGLGSMMWLGGKLEAKLEKKGQSRAENKQLFMLYLAGTGFGLFVIAMVASIVFTSVASGSSGLYNRKSSKQVSTNQSSPRDSSDADAEGGSQETTGASSAQGASDNTGTSSNDSGSQGTLPCGNDVMRMFILSTMLSVLGAVFFICNSMWEKGTGKGTEKFERLHYWAGIWFRVGEAIIFNIVFYYVLSISNTQGNTSTLLLQWPLISLLMGMFLKPAERLVFGIATRLFASVQALVPAMDNAEGGSASEGNTGSGNTGGGNTGGGNTGGGNTGGGNTGGGNTGGGNTGGGNTGGGNTGSGNDAGGNTPTDR